ncbi:2Fe-2S iron-sulfur cluster-binding protein [Streptomyces sp. NBC_01214]|uniref:2Fe-2S iron-sulfur cluster-binding protein n=1 Tax=Streptomyces sp. NBC_01214 TaxID=2903777 RepID=UPI0022516705|nr:2Fe-2S iron-sulfur cluster-binding protein [Streptomyces sp. NBC_01214]MCX4801247.1 2Fe-2S iron-sulfur cluster-binding protein [Streptomyces sp. NBC_01214]
MSENENENVTQGNGTAGWGWEPVPQGGEYDSDATAFVKLPQDMLDALGTGEPLAAPGHGYVPPPMIVPLGSASTDPSATGTWTLPVQWPEAGGSAQAGPAGGAGAAGAGQGAGPGSVGGPIPASIPIPASVAAAFAEPEPEPELPVTDPSETAEWRFPEAAHEPEQVGGPATGQWAVPEFPEQPNDYRSGGLDADWSQAPATLPGGAPAPWAYLTQQPAGTPDADAAGAAGAGGVLPGTDEAAAASAAAAATAQAAGLLGGPGVGAAARGPRVLGGPGVGTALPEGEPVHQAPHDIEAAHGPAAEQAEGARAADHTGQGEYAGHTGHAVQEEYAGRGEYTGYAEQQAGYAEPATADAAPAAAERSAVADTGLDLFGGVRVQAPAAEPAQPAGTDGHGFTAFGHAPEPGPQAAHEAAYGAEHEAAYGAEHEATHGAEPVAAEADPGNGDGPAAQEPPADPAPHADTADGEDALPTGATPYEEEADAGAVAHHEHPSASYVLRVNGADRPVTGAWIGESLLYVLRERLGLAGAKDGCSQGECGACAVKVDGRLVASCLVPAATAAGSEVRTVEGLATNGELSDVQQALCRSGAVQCGFCVPGMAMTIHDLLEGNHAPSELETRQALCGNLCRCSGYAGVVDAVREVVAEREAAAAEPAAPGTGAPEPRIPHQAAPGEGGIHHGGTA